MTARRLTGEVWLIGSGTDPHAATSSYDCHVYLVDGGTDAAVIDCGSGLGADQLLANLVQTGCVKRVSRILVTHYHADHAGGAARLRAETGARVCASAETAHAMRTGDEHSSQVDAAREAGVYPPDYRYPPSAVDSVLTDNETFPVGSLSVTTYTTPGHCDGHVCFLVSGARRTLCTGDAIFAGGQVSIQPIPDCRPYDYGRSVQRLGTLPVDDLLPGHLDVVIGDGAAHVQGAARTFAKLAIPGNIAATNADLTEQAAREH